MEDGEELAANENVEVVQQGARCSLTIVCPEGEDSGLYTCFAYNDSGHASCQAQLTVEEGETRNHYFDFNDNIMKKALRPIGFKVCHKMILL